MCKSIAQRRADEFIKEFPEIKDKEKLQDYLCKLSVDEHMEGYDEGFLSYPSEKLEAKYGQVISIDELGEKGIKKHGGKYYLDIWFNDMCGWALSYAVSFIPKKNNSIDDLIDEFDKWAYNGGSKILDKFNNIPYPDSSKSDELDFYFDGNYKIVQEIEESIRFFKRSK